MVEALLSEAAAAQRLGLSIKTLQGWRYRRTGPPYVKVGGAVRYRPTDLEAWLQARTITPVSPRAEAER